MRSWFPIYGRVQCLIEDGGGERMFRGLGHFHKSRKLRCPKEEKEFIDGRGEARGGERWGHRALEGRVRMFIDILETYFTIHDIHPHTRFVCTLVTVSPDRDGF